MNLNNLLSGKFIFTIVTAAVFAFAVYSKILNGEQTFGIIMLVVTAYFNRPPDQPKGDANVQIPQKLIVSPAPRAVDGPGSQS